MSTAAPAIPKAFIWRRLHSLTGLWFVLFLIEHLITNSQAALLLGESGKGFVRMVNFIHNLPYLTAIEIGLLGIPILIHVIWGVKYAIKAQPIASYGDGSKPKLNYGRNRAYTWQRITSWILLVLLVVHIVKFRFVEYPDVVNSGSAHPTYYVTVSVDPGLYTLSQRLEFDLIDSRKQDQMRKEEAFSDREEALIGAAEDIRKKGDARYSQQNALITQSAQSAEETKAMIDAMAKVKLDRDEVIVATPSFATASLLTVRDTFKSPFWVGLYTVFVLSAVFHAFNGLWTCMLTWGWVIRVSAQRKALKVAWALMFFIGFLGLAAVWGTYFVNLRY